MALFRFGNNMDDMFGNIDNMMNQMMGGGLFDPFAMTPFGRPGQNMLSPFSHMNHIQNMFQQQMNAQPGSSSFVSSSFVSFSSNGNQPPQIYEETKMNHIGPGGVREERHTVRDSRTGLQKMKVGRHINDRGHVMERSRNNHTGDEEENNEFINIEEEEAPQFQQEWSSRMSRAYPNAQQQQQQYLQQAPRSSRLAITSGPSNDYQQQQFRSQSPVPIITLPPSSSPPPSQNMYQQQYYYHDSPSSSSRSSSSQNNNNSGKVKKSTMKNKKSKKSSKKNE